MSYTIYDMISDDVYENIIPYFFSELTKNDRENLKNIVHRELTIDRLWTESSWSEVSIKEYFYEILHEMVLEELENPMYEDYEE